MAVCINDVTRLAVVHKQLSWRVLIYVQVFFMCRPISAQLNLENLNKLNNEVFAFNDNLLTFDDEFRYLCTVTIIRRSELA